MKLFLISGELRTKPASMPFRVYLVAAETEAQAAEYLSNDLVVRITGEADASIDREPGIIGWIGSRTALSIHSET